MAAVLHAQTARAQTIHTETPQSFDVIVYGGTGGGVIAEVSSAREGLKVALIEPTAHVGGMVSGGLGFTDYGRKEVIGGYALEFYKRVGKYYEVRRFGQDTSWYHEPHVAEEIFRQVLTEAHVALFEKHVLRDRGGVARTGQTITAITMQSGEQFTARIFMDTSYEGDLMAQAGVSYTWGREGSSQYGESLAGVRDETPKHQFLVNIAARRPDGKLLPEISPDLLPKPETADKKVQAYNFRMCFSDEPTNQVPFPRPDAYDAARYQLLAALVNARPLDLGALLKIDPIPNHKADVNNNGPFSTDFIGGSWDYPEASYEKRAEIWRAHKAYQAGQLYFLANDPQVPEPLRRALNQWGLCKDEFVDTENWPRQLYIREARRMIGEYVVIQKDVQTDLTKPDSIGMGSYNSDSHNVERIVDAHGFVRNEGDMQVAVRPYQIPYRVMLPKRAEVQNLLVPVAFSASHVAYSSLRMEPQYMILGQAAGVAAKLAIVSDTPVQEVSVAQLKARLKATGTTLSN